MQVAARSDRDLTPEGIIQKVSDASGSKYSGGNTPSASGPPPPVSTAKKPAFMPTQSSSSGSGFNPLSRRAPAPKDKNVDQDGWGEDAPQVTRTQLEKVQPAYQPTKVNMAELAAQKSDPYDSRASKFSSDPPVQDRPDVVKGAYQPVGKVDIASLRKEAQSASDDRPTIVKGAYEPVGKVDIAAIRARAQQPSGNSGGFPAATGMSAPNQDEKSSLPDRSAAFGTPERLTTLPKPKVANRFGSGASTFTGTTAPTPGGFGGSGVSAPKPPVGVSKTFADEGGKTPAQLWAEKKAREGGSVGGSTQPTAAAGLSSQTSGGGGWKSGYTGKTWGAVQTTGSGQPATSVEDQPASDQQEREEQSVPQAGGVGAMRDMFKGAPPMGAAAVGGSAPNPPPLDTSSKPNAGRGVPILGLATHPGQSEDDFSRPSMPPPPAQPRSPTPEEPEDSGSPIRIAMPVSRTEEPEPVESAREEQFSPPPAMPVRSLEKQMPVHDDETGDGDEPERHDPARAVASNVAEESFGQHAVAAAPSHAAAAGGKRALVQYDYEKAEDNELELREGEYVTNIEMVDEDWWMGENAQGEAGLFPSNYVELVEDEAGSAPAPAAPAAAQHHEPEPAAHQAVGKTVTALYDYEAAEDNELSFPEGATIANVVSPWRTQIPTAVAK